MASLLDGFKEWWLKNVTAPQDGTEQGIGEAPLFQDRRTGNPGRIVPNLAANQGAMGMEGGSPSMVVQSIMEHGPKTDLATLKGLDQLKQDWAAREKRYPGEGMMYLDKGYNQTSLAGSTHMHEAAHSLFDQITPSVQVDADLKHKATMSLSDIVKNLNLFYKAQTSDLIPTEATGFAVGQPTHSENEEDYIKAVMSWAKTPQQKAAAQRMWNLYTNNGSAVAK